MAIRFTVLVLALITLITGCAFGGDASVKVQGTSTITTGQELQDLQRALAENAITQEEYEAAKKALLRRSR
ncbi:MAG: SHOCT domain-containing protein [Nitrosomonas sp.]